MLEIGQSESTEGVSIARETQKSKEVLVTIIQHIVQSMSEIGKEKAT